ncbi:MAG: hypothetical protein R3C58_04780 [Parvularculaceae bacterium]
MSGAPNFLPEIRILVRVWHPKKSSEEISSEFALEIDRALDVGSLRNANLNARRKDTYCSMVLLEKGQHNLTDAIESCANFFESKRSCVGQYLTERGRVWAIIQIFDSNFVEITLDPRLMAKFGMLSVGINFENHICEC